MDSRRDDVKVFGTDLREAKPVSCLISLAGSFCKGVRTCPLLSFDKCSNCMASVRDTVKFREELKALVWIPSKILNDSLKRQEYWLGELHGR